MAGTIKNLQFSDGVTVSAPTVLPILENFTSDASYVTAKGSAAAAGDAYFNTTSAVTRVYDGSAWADLGSGGSGEINYISQFDAESAIDAWGTYDDGASAVPVDGTGGTSANLTLTADGTTVLRGSKSFKIAKAAADAQGEGVSVDLDAIDKADQNTLCKIQFDYNTDGTYADGDIVVYIYDVDNAALITPYSTSLTGYDKDLTGSAKFLTTFMTTDSSNYRLCIHVATTSASAYDLYFDNVIVGSGYIAKGVAIGDWSAEYSLGETSNWTTTTGLAKWIRVGRNMRIRGGATYSSGTGALQWPVANLLPSGYTIDETAMRETWAADDKTVVGTVYYDDAGTNEYSGAVGYDNSSNVFVFFTGSGSASNTVPFTYVNGDSLAFDIEIPIAEWAGSGVVNMYAQNNLTEWDDITITLTGTTSNPTATTTAKFKRNGDTMDLAISSTTFTALGSGSYEWALPSGYTFDTSKINAGTLAVVGHGQFFESGSAANCVTGAVYAFSGKLRFYIDGQGIAGSGTTGLSTSSTDEFNLNVSIPITEWAGSQDSLVGFGNATDNKYGLVVGDEGTFTPTWIAHTNVDAVVDAPLSYTKIGPMVYVTGSVNVDPTATGTKTQVYFANTDLPYTPVSNSMGGVAYRAAASGDHGIVSVVGSNTYAFTDTITNASAADWTLNFSYRTTE